MGMKEVSLVGLVQVKAAILKTLAILIDKGGITLKPFLPQLQTTFLKALHDTTKLVRTRAAVALKKCVNIRAKHFWSLRNK